jgi:hypothetical protein
LSFRRDQIASADFEMIFETMMELNSAGGDGCFGYEFGSGVADKRWAVDKGGWRIKVGAVCTLIVVIVNIGSDGLCSDLVPAQVHDTIWQRMIALTEAATQTIIIPSLLSSSSEGPSKSTVNPNALKGLQEDQLQSPSRQLSLLLLIITILIVGYCAKGDS